MNWIDAVHGPEGVLGVFDGAVPPPNHVELHTVILSRRDVRLVFDLNDYPNRPPAKWADQGYDTVQLTLACTHVQDIRLAGWGNQITADIAVDRVDDRVAVRVRSDTVAIALIADFVSVANLTAYLNNPGSACS